MNALLTKNWLSISMGIALLALILPLAWLCPQQFGFTADAMEMASDQPGPPVERPELVQKACRPHTAA